MIGRDHEEGGGVGNLKFYPNVHVFEQTRWQTFDQNVLSIAGTWEISN